MTAAVLLVRSGLHHSPAATTTATAAAPQRRVQAPAPAPRANRRRYYRIRPGDTLGGVAVRYHTSVGALRRLNPHVSPTGLVPGRRLRVR